MRRTDASCWFCCLQRALVLTICQFCRWICPRTAAAWAWAAACSTAVPGRDRPRRRDGDSPPRCVLALSCCEVPCACSPSIRPCGSLGACRLGCDCVGSRHGLRIVLIFTVAPRCVFRWHRTPSRASRSPSPRSRPREAAAASAEASASTQVRKRCCVGLFFGSLGMLSVCWCCCCWIPLHQAAARSVLCARFCAMI